MSASAFIVEEFAFVSKNTLVGFVRVRTPSGIVFHDVGVHKKGDSTWASPPSRPMIGRDGTLMRDAAGKIRYVSVIKFTSKEVRSKFSTLVIAALHAAHAEVLS